MEIQFIIFEKTQSLVLIKFCKNFVSVKMFALRKKLSASNSANSSLLKKMAKMQKLVSTLSETKRQWLDCFNPNPFQADRVMSSDQR